MGLFAFPHLANDREMDGHPSLLLDDVKCLLQDCGFCAGVVDEGVVCGREP